MTDILKKVIQNPRERSDKWISTSFLDSKSPQIIGKYASAEYFVNNLLKPVYFYNKLITLPKDTIVIDNAESARACARQK